MEHLSIRIENIKKQISSPTSFSANPCSKLAQKLCAIGQMQNNIRSTCVHNVYICIAHPNLSVTLYSTVTHCFLSTHYILTFIMRSSQFNHMCDFWASEHKRNEMVLFCCTHTHTHTLA